MFGSNINKNISKILVPQKDSVERLAKIKEIQEINANSKEYLDAFYKEFDVNIDNAGLSELEIQTENESNDVDFDQIEDAYLLAIADNLDLEQAAERRKNRKVNHLPSSQCFLNLEEFAAEELNAYHASKDSIEESELNSTFYSTALVAGQITPKKSSKSIVEQILEDFCSSPQTPKSIALEESLKLKEPSPTFEFKHKILHTYSRQCKLNYRKKNLTQQLNLTTIFDNCGNENEDDDCISSSSGLSVQEDLSQIEVDNEVAEEQEIPNSKNCALDESGKLYNNLLNLSVYFSQHSDEIDEIAENDVNNEEIFVKNSAIDLNEGDEDNGKLESQVMYDCIDQEIVEQPVLHISQHLIEVELLTSQMSQVANTILSEILSLRRNSPLDLLHLRKTMKITKDEFLGFAVENKDLEENVTEMVQNQKEIIQEAQIFSDDDCDDFFLNFKSQDVLQNTTTKEVVPHKLHNEISSHNYQDFHSKFEQPIGETQKIPVLPDCTNSNLNQLPTFTTASNKSIKVSEKALRKAMNILAEQPELLNVENIASSSNQLPTFATVSKKSVEVSEKALQKPMNILAEPAELLNVENIASSSNQLPTFTTASKKPIKVSEKAVKKAMNILAELPELSEKVASNEINKSRSETVSKKSIADLSKGNKKLAYISGISKIDEELELQPKSHNEPKKNLKDKQSGNEITKEMENYADLQFSEWPYDGYIEAEREPLPMLEMESSTLTITECKDDESNGKDIEASIGSTNSNLNISNRKLIARKNLLSLSKRRKHKNGKLNSISGEIPETKNELILVNNADKIPEGKTPSKNGSKENIAGKDRMETPNAAGPKPAQWRESLLTASTPLSYSSTDIQNNTPETPVNNSTLNRSSSNKSAQNKKDVKQRLERLAMYGEPPALSPISKITPKVANKCKRLGLSRGSNKSKK